MYHHHLPQFAAHLTSFGRDAITFCRAAKRALVSGLFQFENPRHAFRASLLQAEMRKRFRAPPSNKAPLLIHFHIFKNAGTSFEWSLEQAFGKGYMAYPQPASAKFISPRELARVVRQNPGICAISSHQTAPPAPFILGREVCTSILIRDPIARIRSIYAYERAQQPLTPGAINAKKMNFQEYVQWRLKSSPAAICNYQVRFCTRTAKPLWHVPRQEELERAIAYLDTINIVGTVSRYERWLGLAQQVLGRMFTGLELRVDRLNATTQSPPSKAAIFDQLRNELGDETAEHLLVSNELDMCLYQVADSLLTRRLAEHGLHLSLLQEYQDAREGGRVPSSA